MQANRGPWPGFWFTVRTVFGATNLPASSTTRSHRAVFIWFVADLLRGDFGQFQYDQVSLPNGVDFRGNVEAVIRKQLVRSACLKRIIGLPDNLL